MSLSDFPLHYPTTPSTPNTLSTPPQPLDLSSHSLGPSPISSSSINTTTLLKRQAFTEAKALYTSGLLISPSNPYSAIAHFKQAALVFQDSGKGWKERREKCLWQVGVCWGRVGWGAKKRKDWERAKEAFEEALIMFVEIGDSEKEATTLYQLSLVSFDVLSASDYLKKAALIYSDLNNSCKEAMCLAELGNLFGKRAKDVPSSLFHWRQALLLYLKIGDRDKEAKALYSIGELLIRSDKVAAYNHFLQARVVFRKLPDRTKWDGNCSYQLGKICVGEKRFQDSVRFFEEASTSFRQVELPIDEAWTLYRLALVMLKVRSQDLAIDYLTEARRLFSEVENEREAEGSCLLRLAEIFKDTNPPMAKTLLEEALEYVDPVKEKRIEKRSTMILQTLSGQPHPSHHLYSAPQTSKQLADNSVREGSENWSFAGATEEGGGGHELERIREEDEEEEAAGFGEAAEDTRDRRKQARGSSEGGEGAWWAI